MGLPLPERGSKLSLLSARSAPIYTNLPVWDSGVSR
jgi:hypothetical protein